MMVDGVVVNVKAVMRGEPRLEPPKTPPTSHGRDINIDIRLAEVSIFSIKRNIVG